MKAAGTIVIPIKSRADCVRLYAVGDVHLGNVGCDEKHLAATIERIRRDPSARWIGMGDYADHIGAHDTRRFDPESVAPWVSVRDLGQVGRRQCREWIKRVECIKAKCIGMLYGNHEDKYMVCQEQQDLHAWLCEELGVVNLGYSCFRKVQLFRGGQSRTTYTIYAHHGAGWAVTRGGKLNRLLKFMENFDADIVLVGHVHECLATPRSVLGTNQDCTEIVHREQYGCITGTYLQTYKQDQTGYGEKKGYNAVTLGSPVLTLRPIDSDGVRPRIAVEWA